MNPNRRPTSSKPITARGAATRARIVEAAARLVSVRGVTATSLDDIMEASGTSKSQLYHYFADRDALMCAVVEAQAAHVLDFQVSSLMNVKSLVDLRKWRDKILEINRGNGCVGGCPIGSLASELADRSEPARQLLVRSFAKWESHLALSLAAMRDRGELHVDANPNDLATAVISALQGGLLLAQTTRATRPLELALDMALEHIAHHLTRARQR
jgi:TetR/AcrR family transcriptional regulator, transcriptional repressor for nem operon